MSAVLSARTRAPFRLLSALCGLAALVGAGCDSPPKDTPAADLPTTAAPVTEAPATTLPTLPVTTPGPPRTTTTLSPDISPGSARISGNVTGPQGPVAGALVRVERIVGDEIAAVQVSAPTGSFTLPSVRGGRYRVRAWKQPDLYQQQPEAFFLAADEQKSIDLRLTKVSDVNAQTTVEPNPPARDAPFIITIFLYAGSVNADGLLQANPRGGQEVQIALGPGLGLTSPDRGKTDGGGNVTFSARCRTAGPQTGELRVSADIRLPLALPECR